MGGGLPDPITRRDFSKGTLLGSGLALLGAAAPLLGGCGGDTAKSEGAIHPWNGFAGVGDYARSNGNVQSMRDAAHLIRDQKIDAMMPSAIETGEIYDMVVIGGGFSGLSAARTFLREAAPSKTCLLIENHPLPGGEAKRNAFEVNGHMVFGPQGSNLSVAPSVKGDWYDTLWNELGIPRAPAFQPLKGVESDLIVCKANYLPMFGLAEQTATAGYFFDKEALGRNPGATWIHQRRITQIHRSPMPKRPTLFGCTGEPEIIAPETSGSGGSIASAIATISRRYWESNPG